MASDALLRAYESQSTLVPLTINSCSNIPNVIALVHTLPKVVSKEKDNKSSFSRRISIQSLMTTETSDETMNTHSHACPLEDYNDDFDLLSIECNEEKDDTVTDEADRRQQLMIQQGLNNVHMTEDSTDDVVSDPNYKISNSHLLYQSQPPSGSCRKSTIKPSKVEDIPIRNKGWRNLPKVDLQSLKALHESIMCNNATKYLQSDPDCNPKRVHFGDMRIRNYSQTIGDNPSVSYGTPIALDWDYEELVPPILIDDYESVRGARRSARQMMLNYYHRRNILHYAYGYSEQQLDQAEKCTNKFKRQRALTKYFLPCSVLEDLLTSIVRKANRHILKQKHADSVVPIREAIVLRKGTVVKPCPVQDIDFSTSKSTNITSASTQTSSSYASRENAAIAMNEQQRYETIEL